MIFARDALSFGRYQKRRLQFVDEGADRQSRKGRGSQADEDEWSLGVFEAVHEGMQVRRGAGEFNGRLPRLLVILLDRHIARERNMNWTGSRRRRQAHAAFDQRNRIVGSDRE